MTSVTPAYFIDTNILIYAYDAAEPAKRARAMALVAQLTRSATGAISIQVLNEFCASVTRRNVLGLEETDTIVRQFALTWRTFDVRVAEVFEAMRGVREHRLSYYDALIWATAKLNGIPYLLSEDGQDGRYIEGVRVLNPLSPDFDLAMLS